MTEYEWAALRRAIEGNEKQLENVKKGYIYKVKNWIKNELPWLWTAIQVVKGVWDAIKWFLF